MTDFFINNSHCFQIKADTTINKSTRRALANKSQNNASRNQSSNKTTEKSRLKSRSPSSSDDNISGVAPLRANANPASPSNQTPGEFKYGSAAKRSGAKRPGALDRINRMIEDSKSNKKPSEYRPEDFIPRSAAKAKAELRAAAEARENELRVVQLREEALKRELAELEKAETPASGHVSRKSLFSGSKSSHKILDESAHSEDSMREDGVSRVARSVSNRER